MSACGQFMDQIGAHKPEAPVTKQFIPSFRTQSEGTVKFKRRKTFAYGVKSNGFWPSRHFARMLPKGTVNF